MSRIALVDVPVSTVIGRSSESHLDAGRLCCKGAAPGLSQSQIGTPIVGWISAPTHKQDSSGRRPEAAHDCVNYGINAATTRLLILSTTDRALSHDDRQERYLE